MTSRIESITAIKNIIDEHFNNILFYVAEGDRNYASELADYVKELVDEVEQIVLMPEPVEACKASAEDIARFRDMERRIKNDPTLISDKAFIAEMIEHSASIARVTPIDLLTGE